jgi:uncharacterized protein YraI
MENSMLKTLHPIATLLGLLVATIPGVAEAAPGNALSNAAVRSGPGMGYATVDRLERGEYVIVIRCTANWCLIHHIGPDGWVSRKLLVNPYYSTGKGKGFEFPPPTDNRRPSR